MSSPLTSSPRFLQIHTLVSYPAVLLNRDDAGLAKRIGYGGKVRTRVSSQCLKRHWRKAEDEWGLATIGADLSVRSREIYERAIRQAARDALPTVPEAVIDAAGAALSRALYGKGADVIRNRQALLLGWPEIHHLTREVIGLARDGDNAEQVGKAADAHFKSEKANLSALKEARGTLAAGLEAALFGRMVTSDPAANTDAAIHVAHAFTVHEQESETDYFTVVDDLKAADDSQDSGSAGIFDTELTSGLFYGYVVVDVPLLVSNLAGVRPEDWAADGTDRALAAKVVEHLIHLIATVSPGAKKGSTAPYAFAQTMLVEAGARQPRSLASAFEEPVRPRGGASLAATAETALFTRLDRFDAMYGAREARGFLSLDPTAREGAEGPRPLDALAAWAAGAVAAARL
jgi:CRISPR system Cascade subunit CasC